MNPISGRSGVLLTPVQTFILRDENGNVLHSFGNANSSDGSEIVYRDLSNENVVLFEIGNQRAELMRQIQPILVSLSVVDALFNARASPSNMRIVE